MTQLLFKTTPKQEQLSYILPALDQPKQGMMLESILSAQTEQRKKSRQKKAATQPVPGKHAKPVFNGQETKALVVEDNPMNQKYLASLLEKWEIPFRLASNGRESLEISKEENFSIILMDIEMPEMNGLEAAAAIQDEQNPNKDTPIIAITASSLFSHDEWVEQPGIDGHVPKPFTPALLFENIREYLPPEKQSQIMHTNLAEIQNNQIDRQHLCEIYRGDIAFAAEMFDIFLDKMVPLFPQLAVHADNENWPALAALAHKLKPGTLMVGLPALEKMLEIVQNKAKNPEFQPMMPRLVEQILQLLQSSTPMLMEELKSMAIAQA